MFPTQITSAYKLPKKKKHLKCEVWFLWKYLGSFWSLIQFNESIRLNSLRKHSPRKHSFLIILNLYSKVSPKVKVYVHLSVTEMMLYTTMFSIRLYPDRIECCVVSAVNHWKQAILLPRRQLLESLVYFVHYDW